MKVNSSIIFYLCTNERAPNVFSEDTKGLFALLQGKLNDTTF